MLPELINSVWTLLICSCLVTCNLHGDYTLWACGAHMPSTISEVRCVPLLTMTTEKGVAPSCSSLLVLWSLGLALWPFSLSHKHSEGLSSTLIPLSLFVGRWIVVSCSCFFSEKILQSPLLLCLSHIYKWDEAHNCFPYLQICFFPSVDEKSIGSSTISFVNFLL